MSRPVCAERAPQVIRDLRGRKPGHAGHGCRRFLGHPREDAFELDLQWRSLRAGGPEMQGAAASKYSRL